MIWLIILGVVLLVCGGIFVYLWRRGALEDISEMVQLTRRQQLGILSDADEARIAEIRAKYAKHTDSGS